MATQRYVGLISGTSMDAVDAALLAVTGDEFRLEATASHPIPDHLLQGLRGIVYEPGAAALPAVARLDTALGREFARAAQALLAAAGRERGEIRAIGSHGQTVLHGIHDDPPYTVQIGDPNVIAAMTGITTVADFRRRDVAEGGQGAPMVPAFHQAVFGREDEDRAVLNIGGIANLTLLPAGGEVRGFDTGPGNTLMDAWMRRHRGGAYDAGGAWAASGEPNERLLATLLGHPYFGKAPPKSTGVETFNLAWLDRVLAGLPETPSPEDVQATLCLLTAATVAQALAHAGAAGGRLLVCGGGARNATLMALLAERLPGGRVGPTDEAGIAAEWVEAAAFAWLAHRRLEGLPGSLPAVTGAARAAVLGGVYLP